MVKNPPANAGGVGSTLDKEDPLKKEMGIHSSILAREIHGQRSLVGYSPGGRTESDMPEQLMRSCIKRQGMMPNCLADFDWIAYLMQSSVLILCISF